MALKFRIEGRDYEYDGKLSVADAMLVYDKAGVGVSGLNQALFVDTNPYAIAAWVFILKRRNGEAVRWEDVLDLDMATYQVIEVDDEPAEGSGKDGPVGGKEEAGTSKPGTTRKRAT